MKKINKTVFIETIGLIALTIAAYFASSNMDKIAGLLQAPDQILSGGGRYTVSQSGTASDYHDVTCDGAVESIVITGSYVRLHGCEVTKSVSHSIKASGHDILIEDNVVHDSITENGVYPACLGGRSWGSGIKGERESYRVTIRGNTVYRTCGEGIAVTMSPDGIIDGNTVYDNYAGNIYSDASANTLIQNNTVTCHSTYTNGRQTFGIMDGHEYYSGWTGSRDNNRILNNVVVDCYDGISIFRHETGTINYIFSNGAISGNTVVNYQGYGRWSIVLSSGVICDNCIVSNNRVFRPVLNAASGTVSLSNNIIFNGQVTTSTPTTITLTPISPTITRTRMPIPATPTRTSAPPSATITPTRISPTITATLSNLWECVVTPDIFISCKKLP